jgi:hypothetical protein
MNAINVIYPYKWNNLWVFDDERRGLLQEPFVFGIPEMIKFILDDTSITGDRFKLTFSAQPFPSYQKKITRTREEMGGNWYRLDEQMEGWLCPALFKYFDEAPQEIYVRADAAEQ